MQIRSASCSPRKVGYRHSPRCISHSSRIPDPWYLHSRVYFAPKELFARLILADVPPFPTNPVFSPFVSAMMKSSVLRRRKSGMKLSKFFADFRVLGWREPVFVVVVVVMVVGCSTYFFCRGAISYTSLVNSVETGDLRRVRLF